MIRKALFWMHLSAGVSAGLIILIMSVTGVILTYERQLQTWEDGPYYTKPEAGQRLSIDELIAAVGQVGDARLLVMASLLVADELSEVYTELDSLRNNRRPSAFAQSGLGPESTNDLNKLAARVEKIAQALEQV